MEVWKGGLTDIKALRKPAKLGKTCETSALAVAWRVLIGDLDYTPRMLFIGSRNPLQIGRFSGLLH